MAYIDKSKSNEWETPQEFFDELNKEFKFTLDPCATPKNAKCKKFYTKEQNGLKQSWHGERVFCNPPYTSKEQDAWVQKCLDESKRVDTSVVMLLPARTDTKRFHDLILPNAEVRFVKGRLKFGGVSTSAPFPSMVVVFGA